MPEIQLYNTLSRSKEPLEPAHARRDFALRVRRHALRQTSHRPRARLFDLRRVASLTRIERFAVRHIQNVTDIDDKIINRAREVGRDPLELARRSFTTIRSSNSRNSNILPANEYPRVTTHIAPILAMVETAWNKKVTPTPPSGDVYFDVSKDDDYGKLSGQKRVEELERGRAHRAGRQENRRRRFRVVESRQRGRTVVGFALWRGPSGLAHRMFGDGFGTARPRLRYSRRRARTGFSAPRKRDRAIREFPVARRKLRQRLVALRRTARRRPENEQVAAQLRLAR